MNGRQIVQIDTDGSLTSLVVHGSMGQESVAVNSDGDVYYSAFGEIRKIEADGTTTHYATLSPERMVFGGDGNLYAVQFGADRQYALYRVKGVDQVEMLSKGFNGESFGDQPVLLVKGPAGDIYALSQANRKFYKLNEDGTGIEIGVLRGVPVALTMSPTTEIFYYVSGYRIFSFDLEMNFKMIGNYINGDPWAMAFSPDGDSLYIAESGVIDQIIIRE
jgi:hypothetical protein